ncbi:amidase family protein [Lentzea sp. HUAS TT2]|uniref:amidase family protein n=1 Tax=Lentzea sp. HUAS TT2 TaxID=3447454 RepID=UPI003F710D13
MTTRLERLLTGRLSSVTLTEQLLDQAERTAGLGAFITLTERALDLAHLADQTEPIGPLHGLPIAVKDNIHVAGMPNTAGTVALSEFVPREDSEVVTRLRAAGAFVLGKANLHELAFGATSANTAFGPVHNPADPDRFAGGSSGGTAAAIAVGAAVAGLGTDTGGSVRIPAALTGIAGLRPTTGRYPGAGVTPLSSTRDTVGPMAASVRDLVVLDAVLAADPAPAEPPVATAVVLGVPTSYFTAPLGPETQAVWEHCLGVLEGAGITLVPVDTAVFDTVERDIGVPITLYEAARLLPAYLATATGTGMEELTSRIASPDVRMIFEQSLLGGAPHAISRAAYEHALRLREERLIAAYRRIFAVPDISAIVFPVTPLPAGRLDRDTAEVVLAGQRLPTFETYIRNTGPGSIAGLPGVAVPVRSGPGTLPFGLALDGPWRSDRRLLGLATLVEELVAAPDQA